MSRVLVTGGSGFVAGWCVHQLLEAGNDVVATVRTPERERAVREALDDQDVAVSRLRFAFADLESDIGWDDAMSGCDYALHVASPLSVEGADADSIMSVARDGTLPLGTTTLAVAASS